MEGDQCTGLTGPVACNDPSLTPPVLTYTHSFGCSVTGGYVYRGAQVPGLAAQYVYGDYCSGRLWAAAKTGSTWTATQIADTAFQLSAFGEDDAGELYFADYATGDIYKFVDAAPPPNAPVLSLSATGASFGSVVVGASATQTITASNAGTGALVISSLVIMSPGAVKGGGTEFTRSGTCAPGTSLTGAQTCTLVLRFAPTALGPRSGTLAIATNGGSPSVPLSGTGTTGTVAPELAASATTVAFGTVTLGGTSTQTVTLRNAGGGTLALGAFTPGGANPSDFARSGTCATGTSLAAGQTCTVVLQFTPTQAGARSATIGVASNGGAVTLSLAGTGSASPSGPVLGASAASLSFGSVAVGQSSGPQTLTLTNAGSGTLAIASLTVGGSHPRDFPWTGTCSVKTRLAAGQGCTLAFRFAPAATGARSATLAITSTGGSATLPLGGTGM